MPLTQQELNEIRHAVSFYQHHNISVQSPRYTEFSLIIDKLSQLVQPIKTK